VSSGGEICQGVWGDGKSYSIANTEVEVKAEKGSESGDCGCQGEVLFG